MGEGGPLHGATEGPVAASLMGAPTAKTLGQIVGGHTGGGWPAVT